LYTLSPDTISANTTPAKILLKAWTKKMLDLSWEPRITKQWDIPHYQDPWDSGRQSSRPESRKNTITNIHCRDIFTGQYYFFETIQAACDYFGYAYDTIYKNIALKLILAHKYFLTLDAEECKSKRFPGVIITDTKLKLDSRHRSVSQFCREIGIKTSNFYKYQKQGRYIVEKVEL
jgi:hypothetical protein